MDNGNITPEFREKAQGKTGEEILALAQEEGVELTEEQLEAISGGWTGSNCPNCGSDDVIKRVGMSKGNRCLTCGHEW